MIMRIRRIKRIRRIRMIMRIRRIRRSYLASYFPQLFPNQSQIAVSIVRSGEHAG